jgi:sialic acid synthase SpsE
MIILAENAINYNSLDEAKRLIEREAEIKDSTGVEILSKFQMFGKDQIVNPKHFKYCMDRKLTKLDAMLLFDFGYDIGQEVFFTPMAPKYVDWCEAIGVEYYKVRYYDRFNMNIINKIIETKKPFFISQSTEHPKNYLDPLFYERQNQINLFCVAEYPAKRKEYHKNVAYYQGISDHTGSVKMLKNRNFINYWELHVRIGSGYLEDAWSVDLTDLEEALMEVSHDG